ncbi:hypothetical protein ACJIZ3_013248 [Penstemon smallii]|uniref:Uncharacterized protein n=1 Tax=Penstemon smallii TaxID=265156 RepID=A0ABD3UQU2_9LAMI
MSDMNPEMIKSLRKKKKKKKKEKMIFIEIKN